MMQKPHHQEGLPPLLNNPISAIMKSEVLFSGREQMARSPKPIVVLLTEESC